MWHAVGKALLDRAEKDHSSEHSVTATAQKRWSNAEKLTVNNIFLCYCMLAAPKRLSNKKQSLLKKFQRHHHLRRYLYQTKKGNLMVFVLILNRNGFQYVVAINLGYY